MAVDEWKEAVERLEAAHDAGTPSEARRALLHLGSLLLGTGRLLTTTEAARMLGFRSVTTLKTVLRAQGVETVKRGNRVMVPLDELLRIADSTATRDTQALERAHDELSEFGSVGGLSQAEMDELEQSRPGNVPWRRT